HVPHIPHPLLCSLSLHAALPIYPATDGRVPGTGRGPLAARGLVGPHPRLAEAVSAGLRGLGRQRDQAAVHGRGPVRGDRRRRDRDRKSTRLNSSHVKISYAVFCL